MIDDDDINAVVRVLKGELITQGPIVAQFEDMIASRVGARHAVAVSSGTAALHIACMAAGLSGGDKAVTSAITFAASANAMIYCGANPVLCDINPETVAMSPPALAKILDNTPEIKLIMPVHMGGLAEDMSMLRSIAGDRYIIEDASHALGAIYPDGTAVGSCSAADMTVFSFHPVKPITTGEGGLVTTNDDDLAAKLRLLRNHGIEKQPDKFVDKEQGFPTDQQPAPWYQEQQILGFNYRLSDIHAALGLSQITKLNQFIEQRQAIAQRYDEAFSSVKNLTPLQSICEQRQRSSHHLYIVDIDFSACKLTRSMFMGALQNRNVGTQVHYLPVYRHPYQRDICSVQSADFPGAERYYAGCLSLPISQAMTDEEVERVIEAVTEAMNN